MCRVIYGTDRQWSGQREVRRGSGDWSVESQLNGNDRQKRYWSSPETARRCYWSQGLHFMRSNFNFLWTICWTSRILRLEGLLMDTGTGWDCCCLPDLHVRNIAEQGIGFVTKSVGEICKKKKKKKAMWKLDLLLLVAEVSKNDMEMILFCLIQNIIARIVQS